MHATHSGLILAVALTATLARPLLAGDELHAKQVAAPPEDILSGRVRLPDPTAGAITSRALVLPVEPVFDVAGAWSFEVSVPVAGAGPVALALLSPDAAGWRLRARAADGQLVPLDAVQRTQSLSEELPGWVVDRHDLAHASAGTWTLHVDAPQATPGGRPAEGYLIVSDASPLRLSARTSTLQLLSDGDVAILAHVFEAGAGRAPVAGALRSARARVAVGGNAPFELELVDDGLHQDGGAGDGLFGALLPRGTSGEVRAAVEVRGFDVHGDAFGRSAELSFPMLERRTLLSGEATTRVEDALRLRIELGALPLGPVERLHVSAEVWGLDARGERVPVAWLSRMVVPEVRGDRQVLPLFLDGRWLDVTGTAAPLELRSVRVQDPDTHVPYDLVERIALEAPALPPVVGAGTTTITRDMLMGHLPPATQPATSASVPNRPADGHAVPPRALMLVHGYCSGGSIWPAADFTQPKLSFLDPNQNRTHDQFAQLIQQTGSGLMSFGVVGHSQGGPAALHLYTYYASGLDHAVGPRLIQSVGSPYQGTPLASLGAFACGDNRDMTPAGSATWLSGIPSWARAEVWYWTTQDGGSVCNLLTSLFLSPPDDGTTEVARGQLPGANSMGNTVGWCHTTGWTYPAQYTDHTRNQAMNANAAR